MRERGEDVDNKMFVTKKRETERGRMVLGLRHETARGDNKKGGNREREGEMCANV